MNNKGIHHITAIVGNPQENVDFYAGVLGLRMVKKTVNFDDPGTYHLYFGDETGNPGTIITFFPWDGAHQGRIGGGQVGTAAYAVPSGSLAFWEERLGQFNISFKVTERFGERYLGFKDPHGLQLEIVEVEERKENQWSFGGVTPEVAIKGFAGATLLSARPELTGKLIEEVFGMKKVGIEGDIVRFKSSAEVGNILELQMTPAPRGRMGVGTVHHIALRAEDDQDQLRWKKHLESNSFPVTPVQDRNYFNAIYFREHGDILFEIATDPPGFSIDESAENLGRSLMLPSQYEPHRPNIEQVLLPIETREIE